jgi:hypothetical protein
VKASLNRAKHEQVRVDPKPGELSMSRVNPRESGEEARTLQSYKSVRRLVDRGNMPIEPGDSWFSPKYI